MDEEKLQEYTGYGLMISTIKGDDISIFIRQLNQGNAITTDHLKEAQIILEANKTKRCFVFIHSYFKGDDRDHIDYTRKAPI